MAEDAVDLVQFVKQHRPMGEFKPYYYYGSEEDSLTVYFRGDADYADRINSRVTLFISMEDEELVGFQIKNVRSVLEDIGWFDVSISHGRIKLKLLFVALRGAFESSPDERQLYRQIGQKLSDIDLGDVEFSEGQTTS